MSPDWSAVERETVSRLQDLIRFDTTNPPGNEMPLAQYLDSVLRAEGIETTLFEPDTSRAALIGRIRGTGEARPVMLLAHMDVVGVERANWSCDPFAGEVRDGYVYGRGAIDDKGMLAANLMTMLLLQRELQRTMSRLSRDVLFVATSDEEAGGEWGMGWLIERHAELLDAEFALNEGGRTRIIEGGQTYLAVQAAEKISHVVTVTAHGSAGHAAIPLEDNAIFQLARALERLSRHTERLALTPITRQFFARLAEVWPDASERAAMLDLVSTDGSIMERGGAALARTAVFNAVLRNGISPAIVEGGSRYNVIPASAGAVLNVRTLPGESIDAVVDRLRAAVNLPRVTVEITQRGEEAPASDPDSAMFEAIAATARDLDPNISVVPYLSTGVTDSARLRRIGVQAYGVLPFPMEQSDEERMHGHDERVPVASLGFGTRLIHGTIARLARPRVFR
ncbi:MAG TPA: M20/M25/M40 family metallo-hydrolase [Gemmatimonadaceae bacterium]|nr:M20/M25/M40 family metallo-hydrolase [Gemmatimonadaceae bacterium]